MHLFLFAPNSAHRHSEFQAKQQHLLHMDEQKHRKPLSQLQDRLCEITYKESKIGQSSHSSECKFTNMRLTLEDTRTAKNDVLGEKFAMHFRSECALKSGANDSYNFHVNS